MASEPTHNSPIAPRVRLDWSSYSLPNFKVATLPMKIVLRKLPLQRDSAIPLFSELSKYLLDYKYLLSDVYKPNSTSIFAISDHPFLHNLKWMPAGSEPKEKLHFAIIPTKAEPKKTIKLWRFTNTNETNEINESPHKRDSSESSESFLYILDNTNEPPQRATIPCLPKQNLVFPTFDRELCKPPLNSNSIAEVVPEQKVDLVIKNFIPGLRLQLFPPTRCIELHSPLVSFVIPSNIPGILGYLGPGFLMDIFLIRPAAPPDKISFKFIQKVYPNVPLTLNDKLFSTPLEMSKIQTNHYQVLPLGRFLMNNASRLPRPIVERPQTNIKPRITKIPSDTLPLPPSNIASPLNFSMFNPPSEKKNTSNTAEICTEAKEIAPSDRVSCGTAILELYIRLTRRGAWEKANFEPQKIGKMRRVEVKFLDLTKQIYVEVVSSNSSAVMISNTEKPTINEYKYSQYIQPPGVQAFVFNMIPTRARGTTTITVTVSILDSDKSVLNQLILHQWNIIVAGHKFESSKTGRRLSTVNVKDKTITLYYSGTPETSPVEVELVQSLIKLSESTDEVISMDTEENSETDSE